MEELIGWAKEIRKEFHKIPEIGLETVETVKKVKKIMTGFGFTVIPIEKNSCVCILKKGKGEKVLAFRADMDALLISEETGCEFSSKNEGCMHACGHDMHISMALAVGNFAQGYDFNGTLIVIFQSGEEGCDGSEVMLKEGKLLSKIPKPDLIYGIHVWPEFDVGTTVLTKGPLMASSSFFQLQIKGKGAHGSTPQKSIDPILIGSQIVVNCQSIVSRLTSPFDPLVLSVTAFNGGSSTNVIPESVKMMGTFRSYNDQLRIRSEKVFIKMINNTCEMYGATNKIKLKGLPTTTNDEGAIDYIHDLAKEVSKKIVYDYQTMASEDFSLFLHKIKGALIFIGCKNEDQKYVNKLHHPKNLPSSNALGYGIKLFAKIIGKHLK
ncbi:putative metallopeptidase [Anaeramoeba flamelloides]|uniref:Metallopeptidase n=1 Tax=Anaeramoeba flamelloides TaxID=1746091 RepID=A0AAV8AD48_9EUKA|nr:putative metallopeptidase [Anaeramoeba flamelloides]